MRIINENLEKIVEGRTLELSKVNQELENAVRSKNQFLAAVNHDVMQPLNAARLFTSALAQQINDKSGLSKKINNSIRSAEEIIHTLLDVSKLDSGVITTNISTFRVNGILQTLYEEFSVIAAERCIKLKCINTSLCTTSDPLLVRRILQNFISNALRHTHTGGRVTIGCRRKFKHTDEKFFTVEVHDTGVGINAHDHDSIFNEFKRLDNQIHDNQKGIGLGLSISKRIGALLDLKITVKSRLNVGSVFALRCEYSEPDQVQDGDALQTAIIEKNHSAISGLNILCIDNDTNVLDAMQTQLNVWHCNTLCAVGYDEAIERLADNDFLPEILLVDYHLENENGIDVITRVNQRFNTQIPAIIISADLSVEIKLQASNSGHKYLRKPINPAALRKLMMRISKNHAKTTNNEAVHKSG